jgi:hypothetical protein
MAVAHLVLVPKPKTFGCLVFVCQTKQTRTFEHLVLPSNSNGQMNGPFGLLTEPNEEALNARLVW